MGSSVVSSNPIILEPQPRGRFLEGVLATGTTPSPGTCMKFTSTSGAFAPGTPGSSGDRWPVMVLLEDKTQGKTSADAYADSAHIFMYIPVNGERLNMLFKNISGTGDHFAIGDKLIIDATTGKLIATTGSPASEPFICEVIQAALTVDTLVQVLRFS